MEHRSSYQDLQLGTLFDEFEPAAHVELATTATSVYIADDQNVWQQCVVVGQIDGKMKVRDVTGTILTRRRTSSTWNCVSINPSLVSSPAKATSSLLTCGPTLSCWMRLSLVDLPAQTRGHLARITGRNMSMNILQVSSFVIDGMHLVSIVPAERFFLVA